MNASFSLWPSSSGHGSPSQASGSVRGQFLRVKQWNSERLSDLPGAISFMFESPKFCFPLQPKTHSACLHQIQSDRK